MFPWQHGPVSALRETCSQASVMMETRSISECASELFGFAALVFRYQDRGADFLRHALNACGLHASDEVLQGAMTSWQLELKSDIDGSFPEPLDYYFESFEEMAAPTRLALQAALARRPSGRVLDIGCGAGRFLRVFAERQYDVTGIEVSDLLVWLCRQQVAAHVFKLGVEELEGSIGQFDVQLLLGHNLGIGATPEGVRTIFESCAHRAAPNGLLVLSSIDLEASPEEFARRRRCHNLEAGAAHLGQTEYWLEYGPLRTGKFQWIHVSHDEAADWAKSSGWKPACHWLDPEEAGHWCAVFEHS